MLSEKSQMGKKKCPLSFTKKDVRKRSGKFPDLQGRFPVGYPVIPGEDANHKKSIASQQDVAPLNTKQLGPFKEDHLEPTGRKMGVTIEHHR